MTLEVADIYVTYRVLTYGHICKVRAEIDGDTAVVGAGTDHPVSYYHGQWHRTLAEATAFVDSLKQRRIADLQSQINDVKNMKISLPE